MLGEVIKSQIGLTRSQFRQFLTFLLFFRMKNRVFKKKKVRIHVTNMSVEFWSKNKSCRERQTI